MARPVVSYPFLSAALSLAAVAVGSPAMADDARCQKLAQTAVSQAEIGLPTQGATVREAVLVPSEPTSPEYCRVLGEISPVDPAAPPVLFQVNLPTVWNQKAVQYGGGGLNGTLVTGLNPLRDSPPGPTPLARGYATFGTDAGHPTVAPFIQVFALNDEALVNHAYGAYKKTHDVAVRLIAEYYGTPPARTYFFGGSEGGREGMIAAQRYPEDYDGIVSVVPVMSLTGIQLPTYDFWNVQFDGGWLNSAQLARLGASVVAQCDTLDGLADGVIADPRQCAAVFDDRSLACADPAASSSGECLTERQMTLVRRVHSPFRYGVTLANGETSYPAFNHGGEAQAGGYAPSIVDPQNPPESAERPPYAVGNVRYMIARDPEFRGPLDPAVHVDQLARLSGLLDATDPDLTRFAARGGKLIMKENGSDFVQSPEAGYRYYEAVVSTMGQAVTDQFLRLYIAPGVNHGGAGVRADGSPVPDKVDLLGALDAWVEHDGAPGVLTLTSYGPAAAPAPIAAWPACRYPDYPRFTAGEDARNASSFTCMPMGLTE